MKFEVMGMKIDINKNPITFIDGLTLLFIGLKLTNNIDWSWIWVLSPEWIVFIIYIICVILFKRKTNV